MQDNRIDVDVLVIGGGAAGGLAAIEAKKITDKVLLVSKGCVGRSGNTPMAEGGIQASFHIEDSPEDHIKDTMNAGKHINDPVLVETLAAKAPEYVRKIEEYGVKFKKLDNGEFFQYTSSGSTHPRCLWIKGGGAGLSLSVSKKAKELGVNVMEEVMITKILTSSNNVNGACGVDLKTGKFISIKAKSVVIATGGNETLYSFSDGSLDSTGDGVVLAYDVGAELIDIEFIQFYPHALIYPKGLKGIVIPEEVYYDSLIGAKLLNGLGEEFAYKYDPERKENTTRDILARAIHTEITEGRGSEHGGIIIDLRECSKDKITGLVGPLYNYLNMNGVDMLSTPLEVAPSAHYQCGGIKIDKNAETTVKGLYAAGECTGGFDGANRLSSNALTEAVVFGMIAGENAARYSECVENVVIDEKIVEDEYLRISEMIEREPEERIDVLEVKKELQSLMTENVGVIRSKESLEMTINKILTIKKEKINKICLKNKEYVYNLEILELLELCNLIENAIIVAKAAEFRCESRGNHFRADYPKEDNNMWKKHTIVKKDKDEVSIKSISVEAKKYKEDMETQMAWVKVVRNNIDTGEKEFEEYKVPYDENKNVLQVLLDIFEGMDRSLAVRRYRCNRGMCGSCTMIINGKVKRACITKMTKDIVIEPIDKYGVIRDVVGNLD